MKKLLFIVMMVPGAVISSFGQSSKGNNYDCKGCTQSPLPCPKSDTVDLIYDTCAKRIIKPVHDGLVKSVIHYFRICNVNDALYTTKISAANKTRVTALPPILSTFNGNLTTSVSQIANLTTVAPITAATAADEVQNYFFLQRYKYDYDLLALVSAQTDTLLNKLILNIAPEKLSKAVDFSLDTIRIAASNNRAVIIEKFGKLYPKLDSSGTKAFDVEKSNFLTFSQAKVKTKQGFQKFINSLLADFLSRGSILLAQQGFFSLLKTNDDINEAKKAYRAIQKDSSALAKAPEVFFAIKNSKCCIISNPYEINSDYLQLNITLLKPKFSDKPDTVSKNKINFFRVGYFKWFDVSAGFFNDNLASKSFYFSNGNVAQEIKSRQDISIGALIHSYYVVESNFKTGPVMGAGVSFLDGKTKCYIGWAFLLGRNNEWSLSGGCALASLPVQSNFYNSRTYQTVSSTVTTPDGGITNIPSQVTTTSQTGTSGAITTYNKFQGGYFIGLTYSFLKL